MSDAVPDPSAPEPAQPGIGDLTAGALVFGSSAAVLVVEIVALRLLAPYLGLTLETSTTVIGLALAAIAAGSWAGGRAADRIDPRSAVAPLLGVSGVVVALTPFAVRASAEPGSSALLFLVAAATIVVPGALLSAVTPMVTKLLLHDLDETGTVVGRLSGIGTVGAIVGTVLTGFVLISHVRVSAILVGLGVLLGVAAAAFELRRRGPAVGLLAVGGALLAGGTAGLVPSGCEVETTYHCATVEAAGSSTGGRLLVLDGLRHSFVDLDDPTYLEFSYTRAYAAAIDTMFPGDGPLRAHHLGAGGVTMPRWLAATRPGSTSVVSEIDGGVVQLDRDDLGLRTSRALQVRVEDGRLGMRDVDAGSLDLVVGDAFGGVSVPWHLTTLEMLDEVHRALDGDGVYVLNLIDHGRLRLARAEARTLQERWSHVAVLGAPAPDSSGPTSTGSPASTDEVEGGNLVMVASQRPLDVDALRAQLDERQVGWTVLSGSALDRWVGDAPVLTDDYAPVDQLLTTRAGA
ncbi:fused MFS/spermidine synthase [Aeromicrobium sp. CnD17-E]|uniref:fused MFS/spermidine synthase n=1 Tax=Aeromicrobium sp. CnD17-E TaxID=2954487 RepID=UPI002096E803|nr:fused MFS/spermidine synthase [Aeromicrobium sp. CnD17-E]MCO7240019.1 fused MFS/spermidine synthase [Aeromicrobium sp. CnD17-E]